MSDSVKLSNIVSKETLKNIQLEVLKNASDTVMGTAGPYGSTTMILKDGIFPTYSKDGKKVLDNIKYHGAIESAILDELSQLTSYVVKEVGDGTTSAIRLSYLIFYSLMEKEKKLSKKYPSHEIISRFQKITKDVQREILFRGRDAKIDDIYKICMISTNGDEEISRNIANIYEKYGLNVYIDLGTSNTADHILKEYDGVTLDKGFSTNAYINTEEGKCIIHNPKIYYFRDPINNEMMLAFLTNIIYTNIIIPMSGQDQNNKTLTPTVILAPSISRDAEVLLSDIETMMYKNKPINRPELLIVTKLNRFADEVDDICKLCGCPPIMNYIDPTVQKKDQETGKAPTIQTIANFCGSAELVEADSTRTKFINPKYMYTIGENGESIPTDIYSGLLNSIEGELAAAKENNEDPVAVSMLKRRLNALKCDLVQYLIGGISVADRDACKDLAEDAVLNCRAAILHGVGYGMNFEGLRAITYIKKQYENLDELDYELKSVIETAYRTIAKELYSTVFTNEERAEECVDDSLIFDMPMNLRNKEHDGSVLSSINTDVVILDAISKIVTIMFTSNQALIPDPLQKTLYKD